MGVLIITHYQRILHMVKPQFVHIMFEGRIVKEGGPELVTVLEEKGYGWIRDEVAAAAGMSLAVPDLRASSPSSRARASSTSTPRPRRRRARPVDRGDGPLLRDVPGARSTAASTRSPPRRRTPTRARARRSPRSRARPPGETVFTRNATEAINLVAHAWGRANVGADDLVRRHADGAPLEHRAVAAARAAGSPTSPIDRRRAARPRRARRAARAAGRSSSPSRTSPTCSARSTRSRRSPRRAHAAGALVAGRRRAGRRRTCRSTSRALGADFYAWTGHKAYGPTGIGVLHGRRELLEAMPPFLGGGHMIARVGDFESTWAEPPAQVRGGHDAGRRGDRARRRRRLARRDRHGRGARARRATSPATRSSAWARSTGLTLHGPRDVDQRGARRARSRSRASTRTTWPRSSAARASACAPATTARSR